MSAKDAMPLVGHHTSQASPVPVQLSRSQILHATARCLREQGYDATTIRTIAGQLGCAVGSIYRYFRDKHDLMLAVTQEALEPIAIAAVSGQAVHDNIRDYHNLVTAAAETYRLMFWLACHQHGATPGAPNTVTARLPDVIERIVAAWGTTLGDATAARRAWSTLHGMILLSCPVEECLTVLDPLLNHGSQGARTRAIAAKHDSAHSTRPSSESPASIIDAQAPSSPGSADALPPDDATAANGRDDVCLL